MKPSKLQENIIRLVLVLFGLGVGLLVTELALPLLKKTPAGSEFSSLADLKKSLLVAEQTLPDNSNGSVPLGAIILPHPDEQIIYDLKPNVNVIFQNVPVTTNSCGMRQAEIKIQKPSDTYRVAIIGDSFTFGWGVPEESAFPRVLEKILNKQQHTSVKKFEVLNFGVPGYSTFQEVTLFGERAVDFDPNAVIVFFIENDFGMPFFIRNIENPNRLFASTGLSQLARAALGKTEPQKPKLPPLFDPNRALAHLADICSERGIRLYLAINPKRNWRKLYRQLWILPQRKDITLMKMTDEFEQIIQRRGIKKEDLTLPTDAHPSELKHKMLAETMAPYFLAVP